MSETEGPVHQQVDARGLNCPLPILRAKKALAAMQAGEVLKVLATDAGSVRDFQAFAQQTGHALIKQDTIDEAAGKLFQHWLRHR